MKSKGIGQEGRNPQKPKLQTAAEARFSLTQDR
jgi:hypothetical protein